MEKASRVKRGIQVESGAISSVRMAPATKTDGISERMSALCSATSVEENFGKEKREGSSEGVQKQNEKMDQRRNFKIACLLFSRCLTKAAESSRLQIYASHFGAQLHDQLDTTSWLVQNPRWPSESKHPASPTFPM